jgi:hypothetical protein
MKKIGYILISLLALWLCFLYGRRTAEPKPMEIVTTDTMTIETIKIVVDTEYVDKPVPYKVEVKDTIYLPNPQNPQFSQNPQPEYLVYQTKIYQDSTYKAQVSGYDAHLDWIETYNKTIVREINTIEQIRQKPKKWGMYAFTELGISNVPNFNAGLGFSYTHNRWTIGAEAGKEIIRGNKFFKIKDSFAFARF